MPLPKPKTDESQDDFISRCMSETAGEFPDEDQRSAVCFEQWRLPGNNALHYVVNKTGADSHEILLYDYIGSDFLGVTASQVRKDLKAAGRIKDLDVRIFSEGGSVFEGAAIYNALVDTGARIRVYVDGLAASIASLIAMAGDEIFIADNAYMMIHNPWATAGGEEKDFRKMADLLASVKSTMLRAYSKRTGREEEEISNMMSEETWMDAQTSVDFGFASEVFNGMRAAAKLHPDRFKYKNVPSALLQQPPRSSDNLPRRDVRFAEMTALVNEVPEDIKKRHASANGKRRSSRAAKLRAKAC